MKSPDTETIVKDYCYSKGYIDFDELQTMSAAEAILESLKRENNGMIHPFLREFAETAAEEFVDIRSVAMKKIYIPNKRHFSNCEARFPTPVKKSKPISGVVFELEDGRYYLLDGYHRLKWFSESPNIKATDYIVISPVEASYKY